MNSLNPHSAQYFELLTCFCQKEHDILAQMFVLFHGHNISFDQPNNDISALPMRIENLIYFHSNG